MTRSIAAALLVVVTAAVAAGCGASDTSPSAAYCARVTEIGALDLLADPAPAKVQHDLERLLALTRQAAAVAPTVIRADARAAVRAQERFNAIYAAHGWQPDPTDADPAFIALAGDPKLGALYFRLERYQVRMCHDDRSPEPPTVAPA